MTGKMDYKKKRKGQRMLRLTASQAVGRNVHASYTPIELREILDELDKYFPVANKQVKPSREKKS